MGASTTARWGQIRGWEYCIRARWRLFWGEWCSHFRAGSWEDRGNEEGSGERVRERDRVICCSSALQMLSLLLFNSEGGESYLALSCLLAGKALFTGGRCWSWAMDRLIKRKRCGRRCCYCRMTQGRARIRQVKEMLTCQRCCFPELCRAPGATHGGSWEEGKKEESECSV